MSADWQNGRKRVNNLRMRGFHPKGSRVQERGLMSAEEKPKIDSEEPGSRRDPEERPAAGTEERKEKMLDKTLADSFPTSDPPSTIPDPSSDEADEPEAA